MDLWGSGLSSWASDQRATTLLKPFVKTPKDLGSNPSRSAHEGDLNGKADAFQRASPS